MVYTNKIGCNFLLTVTKVPNAATDKPKTEDVQPSEANHTEPISNDKKDQMNLPPSSGGSNETAETDVTTPPAIHLTTPVTYPSKLKS